MRNYKLYSMLLLIYIVILFVMATLALMSGDRLYQLLSLWAAAPIPTALFALILRSYHRVMRSLARMNNKVEHLRFLQERRYEQIARRLDSANNRLDGTSKNLLAEVPSTFSSRPPSGNPPLTMEELQTRLERMERRVLGSLENVLLQQDSQQRSIKDELRSLGSGRCPELPKKDTS